MIQSNPFGTPIVIVAHGPFPTHSIPLRVIDEACTLICTDGSADIIINSGNHPHVIIGDQDSTKLDAETFKGLWIPAPNQEKTDLHKALDWCAANHMDIVTIVGAAGGRDDQTQANISLLSEYLPEMKITLVTDDSTISCHVGNSAFVSFKEQTVSIIGNGSITTNGLKFELNKQKLQHPSHGISNTSNGTTFEIESKEPVWVYRAHPE